MTTGSMAWGAALAAAVGVFALLLGLSMAVGQRAWMVQQIARARLLMMGARRVGRSAEVLREVPLRASGGRSTRLARFVTTQVTRALQRAGLSWTPRQFGAMVAGGVLAGLLSGVWMGATFAVAGAVCAGLLPVLVVLLARRRHVRQLEAQLPDAVEMLVNALRAGYSLQASMTFVGEELPAPIGPEFARFSDEQRLGMDGRQSLDNLQARLGTMDARLLVLALLVQRETGGNLSEILDNIARLVRDRIEFRGQVEILTAESRLSALVLAVLPVAMFGLIRLTSATYTAALTSTAAGHLLLAYGAVSLAIGAIVLRRMAHIEV